MMLVVPNLLVTLRIIICPIGRRAAYSLRVDTPMFEATPATHDLFCWENAADEPHPATIAKRFSALAQPGNS